MIASSFIGLINNAAYLLAIVFIYDSLAQKGGGTNGKSLLLQGMLLGVIGVCVMSAPWVLRPGAIFDTRSVVLSLGGLFFGLIPTTIAAVITGTFRFYQGGVGVLTGVAVIVSSGIIGLFWQKRHKKGLEDISGLELYLFGVVVGINMLLWMLTFPPEIARQVLHNISLPVMLIYPLVTLLMGVLLKGRLIRRQEHLVLHQSEELFRAFYDLNLVGLTITSPEKGWLRVNQGLCDMLGYREDELKQMTWAELTHPDDLEADVQRFKQVLAGTSNGYDLEKRFIAKDKTIVYCKLVVRCVRKENGEVDYIVAMVEDITVRKNLEEELISKEKQFRFLVENQRDLIVSFDLDYHLIYANPAYSQTFGRTGEQLVGSCFLTQSHKDDRESVQTSLQRLHHPPHTTRYQERALTVQGYRWFEWQVEAKLNDVGEITTMVGIGRDITVQKEAELALEQSTAEWSQAMDFFEDAIYITDLDDKLVRANQAFYQMTGLTPGQALGRETTSLLHPQSEPIPCPVCQARLNHEDTYITMEAEHPDNSTGRPVEVMVKMIRNGAGQTISVLMGIRDLTRQRHLEAEIIQHRDHLEDLVRKRTAQLKEKNRQLTELNRQFVGRELRMVELKEKLELLQGQEES